MSGGNISIVDQKKWIIEKKEKGFKIVFIAIANLPGKMSLGWKTVKIVCPGHLWKMDWWGFSFFSSFWGELSQKKSFLIIETTAAPTRPF